MKPKSSESKLKVTLSLGVTSCPALINEGFEAESTFLVVRSWWTIEVVTVNVLVDVIVDVLVVVDASEQLAAPVQVLNTSGGAKIAAPWKEQPKRGFDLSPCLW